MKRPSIVFRVTVALFLLVAASVWVLYCGNPQWSKYLYLAQWKLYEQEPEIPKDYDGIWREWYGTGSRKILSQTQYADGQRHGRSTLWYESGSIMYEEEYANGKAVGVHTGYFDPVEDGKTGVSSRFEYSPTGFVAVLYRISGERTHVVRNRKERTKVIQTWDPKGVLIKTRTITWDTNNTSLSDSTVTNQEASNQALQGD